MDNQYVYILLIFFVIANVIKVYSLSYNRLEKLKVSTYLYKFKPMTYYYVILYPIIIFLMIIRYKNYISLGYLVMLFLFIFQSISEVYIIKKVSEDIKEGFLTNKEMITKLLKLKIINENSIPILTEKMNIRFFKEYFVFVLSVLEIMV